MLGQFPVQSRALGTNSMTEIEGLKVNNDFQLYATTKAVCSQQMEAFKRKIYSDLKQVLSFCLQAWHSPISSEEKTFLCVVFFMILLSYGSEPCNDVLFVQRAQCAFWWMSNPTIKEIYHLLYLRKPKWLSLWPDIWKEMLKINK